LIGKRKRTAIRKSKTFAGIFQSMTVGNLTKCAQKTLDEENILGVPECREVTLLWSPSRMHVNTNNDAIFLAFGWKVSKRREISLYC
jgi:hypothetical protein